MQVGIVGFAGSGKSTLFELLTGARPDPARTHSGQVGVAVLADPRLDFLATLHNPKKTTPATIEFLDTPGLLKGAQAENAQRLGLIREGDALLVVLSGFAASDPAAELKQFNDELLLADLVVVGNRVERLEASVKKPRPDREQQLKELDLVKRALAVLEEGKTVASLELTPDEKKPMRSFGLLTDKPRVVVLNAPAGSERDRAIGLLGPGSAAIDVKLELELAALEPDERVAFMAEMEIAELGRDRVIRLAYDAVGMITFFTAGEPEVRGWNLERGATAMEAAGKIHTDLAKGFIRAEVSAWDEIHAAGTLKEAKARKLERLEGKNYIVKDGDVIYFRSGL